MVEARFGRFRKRPVVIEAWQWLDAVFMPSWVKAAFESKRITIMQHPTPRLAIATIDSVAYAEPGDWVIRGTKGELYPCKPDIFEATYEEVIG